MPSSQKNRGRAARNALWLVAAAALAGGAGLYASRHYFAVTAPTDPGRQLAAMQPQLRAVRLITPPKQLPAWRLRLSDGSEATPATLQGRWTLVFFGFTHCPDVCPTTLAELAKAEQAWSGLAPAQRPQVLFVSVDPERDSPAITGDYAHYFSAATLASSPTAEQLAQFALALGMVYMKVPEADGSYSMDHSSTLVLLDPQGRQAGLLRSPLIAQQIGDDLRLLAERAP